MTPFSPSGKRSRSGNSRHGSSWIPGRGHLPRLKLFDDVPGIPLVIFTGEDAPEASVARLEGAGATVHRVAKDPKGCLWKRSLGVCWDTGIRSVFCEGGGRLASQLIRVWDRSASLPLRGTFCAGREGCPGLPRPGVYGRHGRCGTQGLRLAFSGGTSS